jgi:hypothetical protein
MRPGHRLDDLGLLLRAGLLVVTVRIALWLRPLPRVQTMVHALGRPGRPGGDAPAPDRIGWAVRNASRLVPAASCLTQALAAQALAERSGYAPELHLGAKHGSEGFKAHAWLDIDSKTIVGGEAKADFIPLTRV